MASLFRAVSESGSKFVAVDRVLGPNDTLHSVRIYHKISVEEISESMMARSKMTGNRGVSASVCKDPVAWRPTDAFVPEAVLWRRRAPALCKARLKKPTSIVLFARSRFSLVISLRRKSSRKRSEAGLPSSNRSRQLYSSLSCIPSSYESPWTLSQAFIRWTAWSRNS